MAVSRQLLNDVGARLSDVFGFDEVMWVEGPSDQSCVVAILEVAFDPLPGLTVLPVRDTGNFDKRRAADIVAIYRQASMGSALVPPTIGFLLDRDGRTETDIEHITSETKGAVSFLDRVMIENYLLDPQAISEALNSECANSSHVGVVDKFVHAAQYQLLAFADILHVGRIFLKIFQKPL